MDKNELDKLIEKYKQEMLDMAKISTNMNDTEYKPMKDDGQDDSQITVEGQVLYPEDESINNQTVYNEVMQSAQTSVEQTQDYLDFIKDNPKQGELKIQANTARQSLPVSNVLVEISKNFNGIKKLFYSLKTDQSGIIDGILLPAPDKEISQHPSTTIPYASYDILATHPNYTEKNYQDVQIYDGVKSIQPINLTPHSENNNTKEE